jgi:cytochrome o ubiquinol oxidase operon protein cyoD
MSTHQTPPATLKSYCVGFGLSVLLTLAAFLPVMRHVRSHHGIYSDSTLLVVVVILALVQLQVQLLFFLHLAHESKPRWNLMVFGLMAGVVGILVAGSVWIMINLNYHHVPYGTTHDGNNLTSPSQTTQYIIHDEGIQP